MLSIVEYYPYIALLHINYFKNETFKVKKMVLFFILRPVEYSMMQTRCCQFEISCCVLGLCCRFFDEIQMKREKKEKCSKRALHVVVHLSCVLSLPTEMCQWKYAQIFFISFSYVIFFIRSYSPISANKYTI